MAADIKNYLKEKEKRQKSQDDYKKKIRKHRLKKSCTGMLLVVGGFGSGTCSVVVQAKRHIYTGYDTVSSISREVSSDATDIRLKNSILSI